MNGILYDLLMTLLLLTAVFWLLRLWFPGASALGARVLRLIWGLLSRRGRGRGRQTRRERVGVRRKPGPPS